MRGWIVRSAAVVSVVIVFAVVLPGCAQPASVKQDPAHMKMTTDQVRSKKGD